MPPATCRSCQKRGQPLLRCITRRFFKGLLRLVSHMSMPVSRINTMNSVLMPVSSLPQAMPSSFSLSNMATQHSSGYCVPVSSPLKVWPNERLVLWVLNEP